MSRDDMRQLPDGAGFVIAAVAGLIFWAVLLVLLFGTPSNSSISTKEPFHADQ